jgi:hypothetical protein
MGNPSLKDGIPEWLREAGFTSVELAAKQMKPVSTICALAN